MCLATDTDIMEILVMVHVAKLNLGPPFLLLSSALVHIVSVLQLFLCMLLHITDN